MLVAESLLSQWFQELGTLLKKICIIEYRFLIHQPLDVAYKPNMTNSNGEAKT